MSEEKILGTTTEPQVLPPARSRRLVEIVGSFYMLALLVAVGALWLFGELADEVMEQELASMNRAVLLWIHTYANPTLESLSHALSWLGSAYGVSIIVLFLVFLWLDRKRFIDVGALLVTVIGGLIFTIVLKQVFEQLRPQIFPPMAIERSFSFPSGHSLTSFCLWGFICCWVVMQDPKALWRWIAGGVGIGIAALIALSRMYLGVHWPTDVLAGILIATFWVAVCVSGQRWLLKRRAHRRAKKLTIND